MKRLIFIGLILIAFGVRAGERDYQCGDYVFKVDSKARFIDGDFNYMTEITKGSRVVSRAMAMDTNAEDYNDNVIENLSVTESNTSQTVFITYKLIDVMNNDTPIGITTIKMADMKSAPVRLIVEDGIKTIYKSECKLIKDTFK